MKDRLTISVLISLAVVLILSLSIAPVGGQAPAAGAQGGRGGGQAAGRGGQAGGRGQAAAPAVPRMADGHPDLTGIWQVLDNGIDGNIEPHAASFGVRASQGIIVDPPDGKIPYLPAALAKRQANYKNRAKDPVANCYKPGVPRVTYVNFPFQITQTPKMMQIMYELGHNWRSIYVNESEHLKDLDFYFGDSRAKWDGDSLVIDVTDIRDDPDVPTWFDASGNYHSDALHVVERWTRTSPDLMTYRATMEDSKVFSRPWTIEVQLYRHQEKNFRLLDYECQIFKEKLVRQGKTVMRIVED
jgi:hypothetical protein